MGCSNGAAAIVQGAVADGLVGSWNDESTPSPGDRPASRTDPVKRQATCTPVTATKNCSISRRTHASVDITELGEASESGWSNLGAACVRGRIRVNGPPPRTSEVVMETRGLSRNFGIWREEIVTTSFRSHLFREARGNSSALAGPVFHRTCSLLQLVFRATDDPILQQQHLQRPLPNDRWPTAHSTAAAAHLVLGERGAIGTYE
ncbi:hypothetical protein CMUS01_02964 [Colletotrichum musicola]|uniref:Uncharacterized protein n=1 Tax=Colletotrichum musicola TaxID=2175873 RepID=A0A8H6NU96_9PEZI|nr:hypothetical protein CMUS01_02964 [Colletotrichum musicola]